MPRLIGPLAIASAVVGVIAGIIGHGDVAWNVQGIATGLWFAAGYAWLIGVE